MAEEKKGARDISDLKARLGLKKGPAATGPQAAIPGAPAPAAPVPGAPTAARSAVPAPPGFAQPAPPAPAPAPPPDPRRDPFAAAAPQMPPAMMYGYGMPLPGTDDGQPATPIAKPKIWGRLIGFGIVAVAALAAGYISGRGCGGRESYNQTIDSAIAINGEVEKISKQVKTIAERVGQSPDVAKGNPDLKLAADLGTLDLKEPDTKSIFHTNYFFLEDLAVENLFNYYNDVQKLYKLIKDHADKTEKDTDAINDFLKSANKTAGNYGVTVDTSGPIPIAHFAELGSPVCPKEGQTDCNANELKGFKYRVAPSGNWSEKPIKGKPGETIIPMEKSALFTAVASGNPNLLAARDAARRQAEILMLLGKIGNEQKELQQQLKRASEKEKMFTF